MKEKLINWFKGSFDNSKYYLVTLLFSLVAAFIFVASLDENEFKYDLIKFGICSLTLVPVSFALEYSFRDDIRKRLISYGFLIFIFGFLYFFFLPDLNKDFQEKSFAIKFVQMQVLCLLFASFFPVVFNRNNIENFWFYNKSVFISILTAFVFSGVLSLGLILALVASRNLFDLDFKELNYARIFIFCNIFVNTFIFVNTVKPLKNVETDREYPVGLKYFSQYVLLSLLTLYTLILLAYELKIISSWSLPKGWVSTMVLAFGVFGILAFLLLYPIKDKNSWLKIFSKVYYWLLLPLTAMLLVAIYVRIETYGITEPRYIVATLGIWLLGLALYFIISKKDDIRVIPISLWVLTFFSLFGPLAALPVSIRNQVSAFKNSLENKNLDKNQKNRLLASIDFLAEEHKNTFKDILDKNTYDELIKAKYGEKDIVLKALNLNIKDIDSYTQDFNFYVDQESREMLNADFILGVFLEKNIAFDRQIEERTIKATLDDNQMFILINDQTFDIDLKPILNKTNEEIRSLNPFKSKSPQGSEIYIYLENGRISENQIKDLRFDLLVNDKK